MQKTDEIASAFLGKRVEGSESYNPDLLVAIPRFENRQKYGIDENNLPFQGFDIWHCYEFSVLTENNLPVTRVLKLKYSADSPFIIESKSLKLYLNSFNMSSFGKTIDECLVICKNLIQADLSKKLETAVEADFLSNDAEVVKIFEKFENITDKIDKNSIKISEFKEAPQVIKFTETEKNEEYYLKFDSLRSNCRVTHQPDFGDVFIYYKSKKVFDLESIVKYLVSFRCEYHFHEECCEMIYERLFELLNEGDSLFVCALYTRRGGIDITPFRTNCKIRDIDNLLDLTKFARCGIKQ